MSRSKSIQVSLFLVLAMCVVATGAFANTTTVSRGTGSKTTNLDGQSGTAAGPGASRGTENIGTTGAQAVVGLGDDSSTPLERRGFQPRRGKGGAPLGDPTDGEPDDPNVKVTICHKPGSTSEKTLRIPASALEDHLGHGDFVGECGDVVSPIAN